MIRRVLKDMRETWPYWVGMIVLLLVPITTGWIYAESQGLFDKALDRVRAQVLAQKSKPDYEALGKAIIQFRETWQTFLPYLALIHYLVFLLIAVSLFGTEFKHQTMARLLAQPVSRRRIWSEKSLAYLLIVSVVFVCEWFINGKTLFRTGHICGDWCPMISWVLCLLSVAALALASGTLTSLFLRQTHTAFWAALVLPVLVFLVLTAGDALILNLVVGFSVSDWILNWFYFRSGFTSIDLFLFDVGAVLWFAFVYPLAWLKFKKLEV